MIPDVQLISGKILTANDLKKMNEEEIRNRNYSYCTIDSTGGKFLAKVAYNEEIKAWDPTEVFFFGKWISIHEFDDKDEYNCYSCENYRNKK